MLDAQPSNLSARVRSLMEELGLSIAGLATRAGVHTRTVEYLLSGRVRGHQTETLTKIGDALGVTPNDLLGYAMDGTQTVEERWLLGEYRRLTGRQQGELLEYMRDAGDLEEGRVRRRGLRRPEEVGEGVEGEGVLAGEKRGANAQVEIVDAGEAKVTGEAVQSLRWNDLMRALRGAEKDVATLAKEIERRRLPSGWRESVGTV